jgi:eukaryotic-like serine/threonine-protein kinase
MLCSVGLMHAPRFESIATQAPSSAVTSGPALGYLVGEVISERYKLTRELGRGGMGVVWAAEALALGVEVAVKLIQADATSGVVPGRMAREAQAAARLSHPALVRVFDFGFTTNNHPYLVMELVNGETLRAKLEREDSLPAIEAVKILLPIADGLRAAHERGIVHRDLKPDNILLAQDGLNRLQPKLLDFGIAKVAAEPSKLTLAGSVIGTPHYVSPEQAQGLDSVDQRSDVWSFCVMLYELLTGNLPFAEDNYNAQLFAIIERSPPAPPRGTGDARLWQVVLRGLAKAPAERWQSMSELGEALASWLYDHGVKVDASGNALRTVWLDNVSTHRATVSPPSKPLRFAKPAMGTGQSRIPPGRGNVLRSVGLVLVVAVSVVGLFELTFARPNLPSAPASLPEAEVVSQQQALVATPSPNHGRTPSSEVHQPAGPVAAAKSPSAKPANSSPKHRRQKESSRKAETAPRRHDFGF